MKEKIYTIPITDVFSVDCECPLCLLEERLEKEETAYYLGPAHMEPEHRLETNEKGFCRRHFEMLYAQRENTLGLALIIETHLEKLLKDLEQKYNAYKSKRAKDSRFRGLTRLLGLTRSSFKKKGAHKDSEVTSWLESVNKSCTICEKLAFTMDRYIDVIFHLWNTEPDFKRMFNSKKGYCMPHLELLMNGAEKFLNPDRVPEFLDVLLKMQLDCLKTLSEDVSWFIRKFDYKNKDASWKNSRDAVPRSIRKLAGYFIER